MNYELLTLEDAEKLANYDKVENLMKYYKSELNLLKLRYERLERDSKNKINSLEKKIKNQDAKR